MSAMLSRVRAPAGGPARGDHGDLPASQFGGQLGHVLDAVGPAELEYEVPAFDVTELAQAASQRLHSARLRLLR